LNER